MMLIYFRRMIKKAVVMVFALTAAACCFKAPCILESPVSLPFTIDKGGEVLEFEVNIKERYRYSFDLLFYYDGKKITHQEVFDLVGTYGDIQGEVINTGIPMGLRIQIEAVNAPFKLDETVSPLGRRSSGGGGFIRNIMKIKLEPGVYRVRVENVLAAPAMRKVPVSFELGKAYMGK